MRHICYILISALCLGTTLQAGVNVVAYNYTTRPMKLVGAVPGTTPTTCKDIGKVVPAAEKKNESGKETDEEPDVEPGKATDYTPCCLERVRVEDKGEDKIWTSPSGRRKNLKGLESNWLTYELCHGTFAINIRYSSNYSLMIKRRN